QHQPGRALGAVDLIVDGDPVRFDTHGSTSADRGGILRVGDVLEPRDRLAVEHLLHGDVDHTGVGAGAVPVLLAGRNPYGVAGADLAHRAALGPHPPDAEDDMQRLAERMGVPGGARARLEQYAVAPDPRRRRRLDDRVLPHRPGERLRGAAPRGFRTGFDDV